MTIPIKVDNIEIFIDQFNAHFYMKSVIANDEYDCAIECKIIEEDDSIKYAVFATKYGTTELFKPVVNNIIK